MTKKAQAQEHYAARERPDIAKAQVPESVQKRLDIATSLEPETVQKRLETAKDHGRENPEDKLDLDKARDEERLYLGVQGPDELTAVLCLSGGGIRSAAFAMGVLTGLAKQGALGGFHYLSTVSGGGYAGSWLSAWVTRHETGLSGVIRELRQEWGSEKGQDKLKALESTDFVEAEPIRFVRRYASFLSPRWGAISADTWTLFGIYLRNLLITAVVLVPLMAAALMPPRLNFAMVKAVAACMGSSGTSGSQKCIVPLEPEEVRFILMLVAGTLLAITVGTAHVQRVFRPEEAVNSGPDVDRMVPVEGGADGKIIGFFMLPGIFAFVVLTWLLAAVTPPTYDLVVWGMLATGCGTLIGFLFEGLLKLLTARATATEAREGSAPTDTTEAPKSGSELVGRLRFLGIRGIQLIAATIAGAVGGWFCHLVSKNLLIASKATDLVPESRFEIHQDLVAMTQATVGPLLLLSVGLLACTLFIGLGSRCTDTQDREYFARAGAWALIGMLVLALFNSVALFGPIIIREVFGRLATTNIALLIWGVISGLATAAAGMSPTGGGSGSGDPGQGRIKKIIDVLTTFAAPLFLLQVLLVISIGNRWALGRLEGLLGPRLLLGAGLEIVLALIWMGALVFFMVAAGWFVNLNEFSLHGLYKVRLVRTFLGASRFGAVDRRRPNRFSGFDLCDDMPMNALMNPDKSHSRLFHVINVALNVGRGGDLALQYRKALPFTVSALHAGYGLDHYRRTGPSSSIAQQESDEAGENLWGRIKDLLAGFRRWFIHGKWDEPEPFFAGKIYLGTAMTISGAAASPNMGYHSSPIVTFILTLINARLGRWLGNTSDAGDKTFKREHPGFSFRPIVGEAFGLTSTKSPWVYLSDGGHFDNLGLYTMVARRCRYILVSDASGDPRYSWSDLARALQLIRIDFGIEITFDKPGEEAIGSGGPSSVLVSDAAGKVQGQPRRYRVGKIHYKARFGEDVEDGVLIVLKPALMDDDPVDVRNYRNRSINFPHDSTVIQWYSEEQFEAYRKLGEETVRGLGVCRNFGPDEPPLADADDMKSWFEGFRTRFRAGAISSDAAMSTGRSMSSDVAISTHDAEPKSTADLPQSID